MKVGYCEGSFDGINEGEHDGFLVGVRVVGNIVGAMVIVSNPIFGGRLQEAIGKIGLVHELAYTPNWTLLSFI